MTFASLLRVAVVVLGATTLVVCGDTAGKLLTAAGVEPFFVAWSRFAIAAVVLLPFSGFQRAELRALFRWPVVLRAILIASAISSILTALKTEPIANVFGAFFIGPIVSYVLAVLFLGERVTRGRTAYLLLGFAGVMLVVKPGFGATPGIAFALLAGSFYGAYLAATRWTAGTFRPRFLLISQLMIGAVILTPMGISTELPLMDTGLWLLVLASALGSAAGNYLLVRANQMADASIIAPLVYTQLISATVFGVLVFGDVPDALALAGLTLIAVSGFGSLVTAHRHKARTA